jgi:hypothetical protein
VRTGDLLEADLVADGLSRFFAHLEGNAPGGETGGNAARLEDDDLAAHKRKQCGRNASGFASTRRSLDDEVQRASERGENFRQDGVHRKGG